MSFIFLFCSLAQRFFALYTLGSLLGHGGFGSVYEGVCKKDGQQVNVSTYPANCSNHPNTRIVEIYLIY